MAHICTFWDVRGATITNPQHFLTTILRQAGPVEGWKLLAFEVFVRVEWFEIWQDFPSPIGRALIYSDVNPQIV